MVNKFSNYRGALVLLMVLALMPTLLVAGSLVATVERQTVIDGESVMLYLKGENLRELPDVSMLSKNFDVLDSRRSNSQVIDQGVAKSSFMMRFELLPKHLGQVEIPAFTADGETSQPVRIDVVERGTAGVAPRDKVFAEISFDNENPYVQSQVIMSLRILDDGSLATLDPQPPEIPDVQVERLPVGGQEIVNRDGVELRVHTWRYALFPQRNGEIEIPRMQIPGSVKDPGYGGNLILRNIATRRISVRTKPATLNVKPKPAASTAAWWLPVEQLQLTHEWSDDINNSVVGEPLTLTVALTTQGATSNQLPAIEPPKIDGLKIYADVPELVSQPNDKGLISRRTEKWSVIPLREGLIKLPAITIKWWDTKSESEKTATVPAQELVVVAGESDNTMASANNTAASKPVAPAAVQSQVNSVQAEVGLDETAAESLVRDGAEIVRPELLPARAQLWMWIALFSICGWLLTLISWWFRSRRKQGAGQAENAIASPEDPAQYLRQLKTIRNSGSSTVFGSTLMDWARCYWPASSPVNLAEIGGRLNSPVLRDQLADLDSSMYAKQRTDVSLPAIYATLTDALADNQQKQSQSVDPLPRL